MTTKTTNTTARTMIDGNGQEWVITDYKSTQDMDRDGQHNAAAQMTINGWHGMGIVKTANGRVSYIANIADFGTNDKRNQVAKLCKA